MKKLSLAIYWHMHQPVYEMEGTYLMPWTRLHAVKDYLDMVLVLEKFPKLKLNFDVVPALFDTLLDYLNGKQDIHDAARRNHDHALPNGTVAKRAGIVAFFVLTLHDAVAADGQKPQGILCFAAGEREKLWPHADGEFVDAHVAQLRCEKVAELVDENDEPEEQYADNGEQDALHHRAHLALSPQRSST